MSAALDTTTPLGTTSIAPRVVEKIAARAVTLVPGAHEVVIRGLPALLEPLGLSSSTADAHLGGAAPRVILHIEAEWPAPLTTVARRARDEVRATVLELVGIDLGAVEVVVEHFVAASPHPRPRVQ